MSVSSKVMTLSIYIRSNEITSEKPPDGFVWSLSYFLFILNIKFSTLITNIRRGIDLDKLYINTDLTVLSLKEFNRLQTSKKPIMYELIHDEDEDVKFLNIYYLTRNNEIKLYFSILEEYDPHTYFMYVVNLFGHEWTYYIPKTDYYTML